MLIYRKFSIIFKYFLFIYMFIQTYSLYNSNISAMFLLFLLITSLMINDYLRINKITINSKHIYFFSLLATIFISSSLSYLIEGLGSYFYLIYPLNELLALKGITKKGLFLLHFLLYIILIVHDMITFSDLNVLSLLALILIYLFMASTLYSLIVVKKEKEEVDKLNHKFQLTNMKLKEYALDVEKLTALKERNVVSQRFYDSIGHSLMALIMHLEFVEKMYEEKPEEAKKTLLKSNEIAKSSILSLREAVDLLKKKPVPLIKSFNDSIKDIIDTFCTTNDIKINFYTNKNLDGINLIIKNAIYKTINEFIATSIKNATEINIKISIENYTIHLILANNSISRAEIINSNLLHEIENRIASLNGLVNYFNKEDFGFGINIFIPIFIDEVFSFKQ